MAPACGAGTSFGRPLALEHRRLENRWSDGERRGFVAEHAFFCLTPQACHPYIQRVDRQTRGIRPRARAAYVGNIQTSRVMSYARLS